MREAMAGGRGGRGGRADVSAPQSSPRGSGRCGGEGRGEDGEFDTGKVTHKYMCICFVCVIFFVLVIINFEHQSEFTF